MAMSNGTSDSRGPVAKIGDEFIDAQYLKPDSSPEDYEKEPWKHCQDPTSAYLSLRDEYRSEFLRNLDASQQNRVDREVERIKKVRKQFSSSENKKDLMEKLRSSKKEWREEVARNVGTFEREVKKSQRELEEQPAKVVSSLPGFKSELEKLQRLRDQKTNVGGEHSHEQKDLETKWKQHLGRKYQRHLELIQRLKRAATVPGTPEVNPVGEDVELEPLYGLKARVMHFRLDKEANTLVGHNYKHPNCEGRFPNQKISMHNILEEPNGNPLMQECPQDSIRYFHFPTNNMSWIEKAMARYYKEEPKQIDDRKPYDPNARKTEKLLGLAEGMDYEADERLLRDFVKTDPPLHIRRTLDQFYFVTLDDTTQRDKDQVVYRGTKAGYTRVVMVDQLWLWILDDNTIITSFPKRWGRNKPDSSGVHKTIRERLETKKEEIKSIYHLALIIIDQCSRVFFDRTKPLDKRPEVMDLFASAIGNVTEMTTVAYDGFWRALRTGNGWGKALDLNPEGVLFREAQDIAEELKMMKRIYTEQLKVVKHFKRYLFDPLGKDKQGEIALLKRLLLEMTQNQASSNGGNAPSEGEERDVDAKTKALEATLPEAEGAIELIESRQAEIQDLEDSALRTYQQQQTSIVEANAALLQGQSIMALTIVTIFFLPLGFFAAFFGMNNAEINNAPWMTLGEQVRYMYQNASAEDEKLGSWHEEPLP
ncbi:hypothetical protein DL764_006069 [Monosporascus ibericus]|uniref:Uncharacterized protein n=1 Tax=Monosporascus ibericus TaxID=155417 RepID=A0A4Q4T7V4_9PEZI|nr:hypothetical protein DL764_006069 [Monosporascus ibericus]